MNIKEYLNHNKEKIDYWKKIKLKKNKSIDETLEKEKPKNLKDKFLYFDKNHDSVIRHKNWWKIDS